MQDKALKPRNVRFLFIFTSCSKDCHLGSMLVFPGTIVREPFVFKLILFETSLTREHGL